ncbi:TIGR02391 family protein, partial [Aeromicrobium alkaliterrae]|uniref:TIGR02391 family protein n=1 Tax=Aeromicrobium alkaliterrae TaxID=302168 RepID=UPI0031E41A86
VRIEAWPLVPSAVVTFTEDWFRRRGGDPRHHKNGKLVGKDLFSRVLEDQPLGNEDGEQTGWKLLGMGLAQAIGNLHRHNVEQRADAEQLAWRVIGLASLLLGEMKRSHPAPTS